eukprot:492363-Amorphochlora_amoeboformis.AAC.2
MSARLRILTAISNEMVHLAIDHPRENYHRSSPPPLFSLKESREERGRTGEGGGHTSEKTNTIAAITPSRVSREKLSNRSTKPNNS